MGILFSSSELKEMELIKIGRKGTATFRLKEETFFATNRVANEVLEFQRGKRGALIATPQKGPMDTTWIASMYRF